MKSVLNIIGLVMVTFISVFAYESNNGFFYGSKNSDKNWKKIIAEISLETEYIDFTKSNYRLQDFERIKGLTNLKIINFSEVKISGTESWKKLFTNLPDSVETLVLCATGYKGECSNLANVLPNLKKIYISEDGLTDDEIERIQSKFPKDVIDFGSSEDSKDSGSICSSCRQVRYRRRVSSISGSHGDRQRRNTSGSVDDTIADFSGDIRASSTRWCSRITGLGRKLGNSLERLVLNSSSYKGEEACGFCKFVNLKYLDLTSCKLALEDNTQNWSNLFKNLTDNLENLLLSSSNYHGEEVGKFKKWRSLKELQMVSTTLDPGFQKWTLLIKNLTQKIELLHLSESNYSGENIAKIRRFSNLRELFLKNCRFSQKRYVELSTQYQRLNNSASHSVNIVYPSCVSTVSDAGELDVDIHLLRRKSLDKDSNHVQRSGIESSSGTHGCCVCNNQCCNENTCKDCCTCGALCDKILGCCPF